MEQLQGELSAEDIINRVKMLACDISIMNTGTESALKLALVKASDGGLESSRGRGPDWVGTCAEKLQQEQRKST